MFLLFSHPATFFAGGTRKRIDELKGSAYNLVPNKLKHYANRFASSLLVNQYRLDNFDAVKRWHTTGVSLELAAETSDKDDTKQKQRSKKAYEHADAKLVHGIVHVLYGEIPALVRTN